MYWEAVNVVNRSQSTVISAGLCIPATQVQLAVDEIQEWKNVNFIFEVLFIINRDAYLWPREFKRGDWKVKTWEWKRRHSRKRKGGKPGVRNVAPECMGGKRGKTPALRDSSSWSECLSCWDNYGYEHFLPAATLSRWIIVLTERHHDILHRQLLHVCCIRCSCLHRLLTITIPFTALVSIWFDVP